MHRRYVKEPSAGTQVSTGANEKRFINKTYIYRFLKQRSFASSRGTHSKTGKNTMKPLIRILSLWLAALCFGACTDDDLIDGTPTPEPETGIVIRLSAGDLEQTRTELTSQANLHNVKEVYALLYQGHGDDATFYACDKLDWNPKDSTDETGVQEQRKEFLLPQSKNLAKGAYTVLCVGLDDQSGETYDLPAAIQKEGSTLSEAKATLAGSKGKEDIAKSELFAGWNQFHFAPDSLNIVEVEMKRRVAGVLCYLTDVPYQLTKEDGTWRVQKVILRLFTQQNKSISLLRPEQTVVDNKYVDDFGDASFEEDSNSDILMEFNLSGYSSQGGNEELYEIPVTGENQLPNTLLGGVYMIPINNETADQNTLQIELWGKKIENDELTGDEACIRSFPAINDDIDLDKNEESGESTPSYTYPIRPNIIYHIGTKPSNDGTTGDTPESLAGTKVNIVAEEWTDQEIHVEFPSVPIMATMELLDEKGQPYNTDSYVFDCIGTDEVVLEITNSVMNNPWELDAIGEGVYFRSKEGNSYSKEYNATDEEYESKNPIKVHVLITDYAEKRDYTQIDWKKDIRTTLVKLTAKSSSGDVEYSLNVKQYNAINVIMKDNDNQEQLLGFSRFDWGTIRNSSGVITTDGTPHTWGFDGWTVRQITGTNIDSNYAGYLIYNYAIQQAEKDEDYAAEFMPSSALYLAGKDKIEGINGNLSTTGLWYLPASYELEAFLNFAKAEKDDSHVKVFISDTSTPHNKYFTSNPRYSHRVWSYYIDTKNDVTYAFEATGDNRTDSYYMRQCCRINELK